MHQWSVSHPAHCLVAHAVFGIVSFSAASNVADAFLGAAEEVTKPQHIEGGAYSFVKVGDTAAVVVRRELHFSEGIRILFLISFETIQKD